MKAGFLLLVPILFLACAFIQGVNAADTHTAADCSSGAIQTAIGTASDGDTVSVPACDKTIWTGSVTIPSSKGITLQGAGTVYSNGIYSSSGTYIDLGTNSLIVQTKPSGNSQVRITGFHFSHSGRDSTNAAIIMRGQSMEYDNGAQNWRIDHNYFNFNGETDTSHPGVMVKGWTWGLVDHSVFYHQGRAIFVHMGTDVSDNRWGESSWDIDLGGPIDWGGPKAVYFEDNWFYGDQIAYDDQIIDSNYGARIVFRFNHVEDMYYEAHSGCSSGIYARSSLQNEVYKNTFVIHQVDGTPTIYRGTSIRGGTFLIWDNSVTGTFRSSNPFNVDYPPGCYDCSAGGYYDPYDQGKCTTPICGDQIGTGPDASHSGLSYQPGYAWNNKVDGVLKDVTTGVCGPEVTQDGREYFNEGTGDVGRGTTLPGACTVNTAYFKTNQGTFGALYKCTSSNTWTLYYTPYEYPHPLQSGTSPPQTCPDGTCFSGETCPADSCCNGVSYTASQICCSGIVYTGNCCSSSDCSSGYTCSSHVCVQSSQTCSQLGGTDCCASGEICPGTSYSGASDCSGACCSQTCTAGSKTITVDSTYSGYSTAPIDDGVVDAYGGKSTTWASAESLTDPHWITISFPSTIQISYANLWWAYNSVQQELMDSQQVQVQYWDGSSYITAATLPYSRYSANSSVTFSPVTTSSIRFYQPAGMGNPSYPDVLWITEAEYGYTQACIHKSDTDCSGCVSQPELMSFISRWYTNNQDVTLRELIETIGLWKRGC